MPHIVKAEKFELRRSPRAEVSQTVTAIDDYGSRFVERVLRGMEQLR